MLYIIESNYPSDIFRRVDMEFSPFSVFLYAAFAVYYRRSRGVYEVDYSFVSGVDIAEILALKYASVTFAERSGAIVHYGYDFFALTVNKAEFFFLLHAT